MKYDFCFLRRCEWNISVLWWRIYSNIYGTERLAVFNWNRNSCVGVRDWWQTNNNNTADDDNEKNAIFQFRVFSLFYFRIHTNDYPAFSRRFDGNVCLFALKVNSVWLSLLHSEPIEWGRIEYEWKMKSNSLVALVEIETETKGIAIGSMLDWHANNSNGCKVIVFFLLFSPHDK